MRSPSRRLIAAATALVWVATFGCSGGGGSGASTSASCLSAPYGCQCTGCLESFCSSELSNFNSGCGSYIACACPGGAFSQSASQASSCQAELTTTSCSDANTAMGGCLISRCNNQCQTIVDGGSSSDCTGMTAFVSCYLAIDMMCNESQVVASAVASQTQMCMQGGGTPGTICPTAGLQGCCKNGSGGVCYYAAADVSAAQMTCARDGGIWTASP